MPVAMTEKERKAWERRWKEKEQAEEKRRNGWRNEHYVAEEDWDGVGNVMFAAGRWYRDQLDGMVAELQKRHERWLVVPPRNIILRKALFHGMVYLMKQKTLDKVK